MRMVGPYNITAAEAPGKGFHNQLIGGWVGPRCGLDGCGKSRPHWGSNGGTSSPVSESLYRQSCLGPQSPLTAAANGSIVPTDYDRRVWNTGEMIIGGEKPKWLDNNNLPQ